MSGVFPLWRCGKALVLGPTQLVFSQFLSDIICAQYTAPTQRILENIPCKSLSCSPELLDRDHIYASLVWKTGYFSYMAISSESTHDKAHNAVWIQMDSSHAQELVHSQCTQKNHLPILFFWTNMGTAFFFRWDFFVFKGWFSVPDDTCLLYPSQYTDRNELRQQ